ncbi:MAG: diaminopimelate decarboxylase family protein [Candidatus Limnocylindrales bacterium]
MTPRSAPAAAALAAGRVEGDRGPAEEEDEIWRAGRLAGLDPRSLARQFGTPLYVYDLDALERRAGALRAALPDRVEIAYAVKANPSLAVIARLARTGVGADVSSAGELAAALRAGVPPGAIVVTGPGKSQALLRQAVRAGVRAIAVDSPGEVRRVERTASSGQQPVGLLFRLAAPPDAGGPDHQGPTEHFGMTWDDAVAAARHAVRSPALVPLGVHVFAVGAVRDPVRLAAHAAWSVAAGRRLAAAAGFRLQLADVGGGLGIPYREGEAPLDLGSFAGGLRDVLHGAAGDPAAQELRILIEPGRYLGGPIGAYLARVVDVKDREGRCITILDGGINHFLAPALPGRMHRMQLVAHDGAAAREPVAVLMTGPLCTALDILGQARAFPRPQPGDLVAFLDAGAYGFTQSMPWFLSHTGPAEVAVSAGKATLVRARPRPSDLLRRQRISSE